jgi:Spy/CpxP family protein refolding chaperone
MAFAQDATNTTAGSSGAGQGQRMEQWKEAFAKLDLSEAQKQQIEQIRSTVTDRKERREQIMAVLTPEQKRKLMQMIAAHRGSAQSGTASGT